MTVFRSRLLVRVIPAVIWTGLMMATNAAEDTIRIGVSTLAPEKANPYQGITLPAIVPSHTIFDSINAVDNDGNVVPQLAVAWSSEDAVTWRFNLRPGVRFSNGEPFNALAVVTSVEHMHSDKGVTETIPSMLYHIEGVEVVDDLSVDIKLSERDALFPIHVSIWRVPAPGAWRQLGLPAFGSAPVGTGPFQLIEWNDYGASLRAYKDSWRPPRLERIEFLRIPDQAARFQALMSEAIDMALELAPEDASDLEESGGRLVARLTPSVQFLAFLTFNDSPTRDVLVRRALNYVDREMIVEHLLDGSTVPASQLAFPGSFGYNENLQPYPYDPDKARALLREAGYPDGLDLQLGVAIVGGNDSLYYQQIAADLRKVGIRVDLQAHPRGLQLTNLFTGDMKGDVFNLLVRGHDPLNAYRHRTCLELVVQRAPYHCDPGLLPLLKRAREQIDPESARRLYREVLAYEYDHPPGLFLWQTPAFDGLSARVSGYLPVQDVISFETLTLREPEPE